MNNAPFQTISYATISARTKAEAQKFGAFIRDGKWTIDHARKVLAAPDANGLSLFELAGLAQAVLCFTVTP